jgi:hypothetical protein
MPVISNSKKAKVTQTTFEEAQALRALWESTKHPSQAVFGEVYGIGNQSAVGQFLRGAVPLSLKAAQGFAKGLNCSIADFSPRLATQYEGIAALLDGKYAKTLSPGGIADLHQGQKLMVGTVGKEAQTLENCVSEADLLASAFATLSQSLSKLDNIGRKQVQPLFEALLANPKNAAELGRRYIATTGVAFKKEPIADRPQLSNDEDEFATKVTRDMRSGKLKPNNIQRKVTPRDTSARSK